MLSLYKNNDLYDLNPNILVMFRFFVQAALLHIA